MSQAGSLMLTLPTNIAMPPPACALVCTLRILFLVSRWQHSPAASGTNKMPWVARRGDNSTFALLGTCWMHAFDFGTSTIVSMMVRTVSPGFNMFSVNKRDLCLHLWRRRLFERLAKLKAMRRRTKWIPGVSKSWGPPKPTKMQWNCLFEKGKCIEFWDSNWFKCSQCDMVSTSVQPCDPTKLIAHHRLLQHLYEQERVPRTRKTIVWWCYLPWLLRT